MNSPIDDSWVKEWVGECGMNEDKTKIVEYMHIYGKTQVFKLKSGVSSHWCPVQYIYINPKFFDGQMWNKVRVTIEIVKDEKGERVCHQEPTMP